MLNPQLAKRLWKTAVEHHVFFRLKEPRISKKGPIGFLAGSSGFQYSGRTFFQYRTAQIDRSTAMDDDLENSKQAVRKRTASVPAALNRGSLLFTCYLAARIYRFLGIRFLAI